MKKLLLASTVFLGLWLYPSCSIHAQGIGVNPSGNAPDNSAMLDISSTRKGLLIPRVALQSTTDVTTIPTPATSLLVYNTNAGMSGGGIGYWYWNGSQWTQLTTGASASSCPSGSIDAGSFCIDQNERTSATWFNANIACGDLNGRLCSWGEWYYACQKTALGLSNMTNNYEWIDNAVACQSNTNTQYNNPNNAAKQVGNSTCTANQNASVTGTATYRCCYNK